MTLNVRPYTYFKQLSFLIPLLEERPEKTDNADPSPAAQNNKSLDSIKKSQLHRKRKLIAAKEDILKGKLSTNKNIKPCMKLIEKSGNFDKYQDQLFFLSLVGAFQEIPDQFQLQAKTEILKVLRHYTEISTQYPCETQNCYDDYFTASSSNPDPHYRVVLEEEILSKVSTPQQYYDLGRSYII